jgi:hypothetical protein
MAIEAHTECLRTYLNSQIHKYIHTTHKILHVHISRFVSCFLSFFLSFPLLPPSTLHFQACLSPPDFCLLERYSTH